MRSFVMFTWTTLTTKNSEIGNEAITSTKEQRAISEANIPGPSSQAESIIGIYLAIYLFLNTNLVKI